MPKGSAVSRPSQLASFALIANYFPEDIVIDCLDAANCMTYRFRSLPVEFVFYLSIFTGLNKDVSFPEAYRLALEGYEEIYGKHGSKTVTPSGIHYARKKLGFLPLKAVFESLCKPVASANARGCYFKNRRIVAVDGCYINVADTPKNDAEFGRPSNTRSAPSSYPQIKLVCLAECGTHVVFDMVTGAYTDAELTLAKLLIPRLPPDCICLADRLYFGYGTWKAASQTGASLLWRLGAGSNVVEVERLQDGSYTAHYFPSSRDTQNKDEPPLLLRCIDFEIQNAQTKKNEVIRLVTNIMIPAEASAAELARLYMQRWEIELIYGEVKVKLNDNEIALRSGTPELAKQELYSLIMAHNVVRKSIYEAAAGRRRIPLDPDDFSYVGAINILRRKSRLTADFSP